ncbi:hypothetical protein ACFLUU_07095 [Chloroflexota bacterium]
MMKYAKASGFVLLIIGTLGLIITEFILGGGRAATLTFTAFNVIGLATLAFAHWGIKRYKRDSVIKNPRGRV